MKSHAQLQRALPQRGPAPSCLPTWGSLSPTSPSFKSHPLHRRCRASDTFSRRWKYMARRYYWRATAETLRTDVSRAKESMSTGGKITLRRELIERGGSHEVWYGGEGGDSKSRKRHLFTAMELYGPLVHVARHCPNTENRCFSRQAGGEGGIRTHGPRKGTAVFETARFGRSRTSPEVTPNRDH